MKDMFNPEQKKRLMKLAGLLKEDESWGGPSLEEIVYTVTEEMPGWKFNQEEGNYIISNPKKGYSWVVGTKSTVSRLEEEHCVDKKLFRQILDNESSVTVILEAMGRLGLHAVPKEGMLSVNNVSDFVKAVEQAMESIPGDSMRLGKNLTTILQNFDKLPKMPKDKVIQGIVSFNKDWGRNQASVSDCRLYFQYGSDRKNLIIFQVKVNRSEDVKVQDKKTDLIEDIRERVVGWFDYLNVSEEGFLVGTGKYSNYKILYTNEELVGYTSDFGVDIDRLPVSMLQEYSEWLKQDEGIHFEKDPWKEWDED